MYLCSPEIWATAFIQFIILTAKQVCRDKIDCADKLTEIRQRMHVGDFFEYLCTNVKFPISNDQISFRIAQVKFMLSSISTTNDLRKIYLMLRNLI